MSRTTTPCGSSGFTLMELVATMLIVAILAAIGVPSFKYVTSSNRIATEINGLLGDMQFARSEAIKEGLPVTVCASITPFTGCSNSTTWNTGWIVFSDSNGNKIRDTTEAILRVQPAFPGTDTLVSDNNFQAIVFNRLGYAATGATVTVTVTLHGTPVNSAWTRCLAITTVGSMTTQKAGQAGSNCT